MERAQAAEAGGGGGEGGADECVGGDVQLGSLQIGTRIDPRGSSFQEDVRGLAGRSQSEGAASTLASMLRSVRAGGSASWRCCFLEQGRG
jgi:hypothetical protein